jgi:RHS repeat-associated protein
MTQPGRKFSLGGYRYGFNGKENDNEVKGEGNQQDYGFRMYDPRLGKFLSVDPLTKFYPWNSTYAFAENDVMRSIDLEGAEKYIVIINKSWGENKQQVITYDKVELKKPGTLGNGVAVKLNMFGSEKYLYGESANNSKDFIKYYEGNGIPGHPLERYNDSRGYATIGYGHLMTESDKRKWPVTASNEPFVVGSKINQLDADGQFNNDYQSHKDMALGSLKLDWKKSNQKDAVIDFGYNIKNAKQRIGGFTDEKGEKNFLEYMSGGSGLEKRRTAEAILFKEGDYLKLDRVLDKKSIQKINSQLKSNGK